MPSLAERIEDVQSLAAFFCAAACERHRLPRLELSPNTMRAIQAAEWPGNVRQLAHAIEAAVIRASGDGVLRVEGEHMFPNAPPAPAAGSHPQTFQQATRSFQEDFLRQALHDTEWNISETARRLDLTRAHIYNLIHAFGLERQRG